jgi:hypothetical protein
MGIRAILSHELVVGDYLGVISSVHHPEHRVEKLEYIDANLGRAHLKHDAFYLEAPHMGPVTAWCHGIAGNGRRSGSATGRTKLPLRRLSAIIELRGRRSSKFGVELRS